jgi:hypothetical protein
MFKELNGDLMVTMHFIGLFSYVNDNKKVDYNNIPNDALYFLL